MNFTEGKLQELNDYLLKRRLDFIAAVQPYSQDNTRAATEAKSRIDNFLSFLKTLESDNADLNGFLEGITSNPGDDLYSVYLLVQHFMYALESGVELDLKLVDGEDPMKLKIDLQNSKFCVTWRKYGFDASQNWQPLNGLQANNEEYDTIQTVCAKNIAHKMSEALNNNPQVSMSVKQMLPDVLTKYAESLQLPITLSCKLGNSIKDIINLNQDNQPEFNSIEKNEMLLLQKDSHESIKFYFDLLLYNSDSAQIDLPNEREEFVDYVLGYSKTDFPREYEKYKYLIRYIYQILSQEASVYVDFKLYLKKVLAYPFKRHGDRLPIRTFYLLMDTYGLEYTLFDNFSACIRAINIWMESNWKSDFQNMFEKAYLDDVTQLIGTFFSKSENNKSLRKYFLTEFEQDFRKHLQKTQKREYIDFLTLKIPNIVCIESERFKKSYISLLKDIRIFIICFSMVKFPDSALEFSQKDFIKYLKAATMYCQKTELKDEFSAILKEISINACDKWFKGKSFSAEELEEIVSSIQELSYKQELIDKLRSLSCIPEQDKRLIDESQKMGAAFLKIRADSFDNQKILAANIGSQKSIFSKIFFVFGILLVVFGIILLTYINLWAGIGLIAVGLVLVAVAIYNFFKKSKIEVSNQNTVDTQLDQKINMQSIMQLDSQTEQVLNNSKANERKVNETVSIDTNEKILNK